MIITLVAVLLFPQRASAALLSFGKEAEAQVIEEKQNTQTIALLEGFSAPEVKAVKTEIEVVGGEGVLLPVTSPTGASIEFFEEGTTGEISLYVVHEGDTLADIAKMFGVSTNTIKWANELESSKLKVGQTLVILPITGVRYQIKKGDTLKAIAKKFGGDVTEIEQFNELVASESLTVGDYIIIPDGEIDVIVSDKKPTVQNNSKNLKNVAAGYYIRPIGVNSKWRVSQRFHGKFNAYDIASPTGTPILASAGGIVVRAKNSGWNTGYGKVVAIMHENGTQTLYAHMSETLVKVGDRVDQGGLIGLVGSTGRSTGPHLHFEIRNANARAILTQLY